MFSEFANQIWTVSATGAAVTNNTDESIDGSSKKIVFTEADAWALSTFTSVNLSAYEEVSLQIYIKPTLSGQNIFKLEINGNEYNFTRFSRPGWHHVLIDCQGWGAVTTIKFTSLLGATVLFVDLIGYRKVTYETMDYDVVEAIKNAISLNYNVATTLSANAPAGSRSISLASAAYINNTTMLRLTDGATTEDVQLQKSDGTLMTPLVNAYASATTVVTALCPVISEENQAIESNPVCGIFISDTGSENEDIVIPTKGVSTPGAKLKRFLGALQITVYIDCSSKKKFLSLCRQFDYSNGESFYILLDGEKVELYQEANPITTPETDLGNLPRKAYFYSIEPQPITVSTKREIETITIDLDSEAP